MPRELHIDGNYRAALSAVGLTDFQSIMATGLGTPVTIQLPELAIAEVRGLVALPAKGGYVLAGHDVPWDEQSWRFVVLEVTVVRR